MVKTALDMGATVRIGFEDSDMIARGCPCGQQRSADRKGDRTSKVQGHDAHDSRRGARHAQDPAAAPLKREERNVW